MILTKLKNDKEFKWFKKGSVMVKGFLFDDRNYFYNDEKLATFFTDLDELRILDKLRTANGLFLVIIKDGDNFFAAVDPLRSLPLFYAKSGENLFISDDAWSLIKEAHLTEVDEVSSSEFLLSGYTVGNYTLFRGLHQVQAGQYLRYNDETKELKVDFYYKHLHGKYLQLERNEYFDKLDSIYRNVFSRLIESAQRRTIVIPLRGGYDSRSIVTMLKKFDYENVICFTYGRPESFEVETSEKVAKKLGYKHYFVNYSEKEKWLKIARDIEYLFFASNASSLPHVQEYIAVSVLKEKSLLPSDAIFVPGFCGDLLGGSYVPREVELGRGQSLLEKSIEDYIFTEYFNLDNKVPIKHIIKIKERISKEILNLGGDIAKNVSDFDSLVEAFFTNHKVSKFVVNALRVYGYFGYEWRMPLWDKELYEFYYQVPLEYRLVGNKLYNGYLIERLFTPFGVGFRKRSEVVSLYRKRIGYSQISDKLWKLIRSIYWTINSNKKGLTDFNGFSNLYEIFKKDLLKEKINYLPSQANINSIFALWFVEIFLKSRILSGEDLS